MAKEVSADNSSGVFAMVMAVLSIILPFSAIPFGIIGGIICAILGIVFGIIQIKKAKNSWAVCAVVFSIIGLVLSIILAYEIIAIISSAAQQYAQLQQSGALSQLGAAGGLNGIQ
jgi:hypothetical protein